MICDEAHTALGEKTSAAIRSFPEPVYIGMTATEQLIAKQVSDVFPASVDDLPARRRRPSRADRPASLPARSARRGDQLGADRRRRLRPGGAGQGARPRRPQPGRGEPLPRSVRLDARASSTRPASSTPTTSRRSSAPRGLKAEAVSGRTPPVRLAEILAALRARRHRRARERDAARRGLELAAGDRGHASRADREPARLPAADRPDHAAPSAQGGRQSSSTSSRRGRRTATG